MILNHPRAEQNTYGLLDRFEELQLGRYNRESNQPATNFLPWFSGPLRSDQELISVSKSYLEKPLGILTDHDLLSKIQLKTTTDFSLSVITEWDTQSQISLKPDSRLADTLEKTLELLKICDPLLLRLIERCIKLIVPITHELNGVPTKRGFSSHKCFGMVFLTFYSQFDPEVELSIDLVHEVGHHCLMLLQYIDRIIEGDQTAPVYSSVRKVERPAIMAFHALVAGHFMIRFMDSYRLAYSSDLLVDRSEHLRENQVLCMRDLEKTCKFTKIGQSILNEIKDAL